MSLLNSCPAWTKIDPKDEAETKKVMATLEAIATFEIGVIRSAIAQYLTNSTPRRDSYLDRRSKVFLLNRYLFNVPQLVGYEAPLFGAWRNPTLNGKVDILWPFSADEQGRLHLTGAYSGYTGEAYDAIGEFDYFLREYGIRRAATRLGNL